MKEFERFDLLQKNGYGIYQHKKWFSYGIDAVLISHFSQIQDGDIVMDLGTGNGIIPLLISLKSSPKKIYGVEKQNVVADMARRSIDKNGINNIQLIESDILHLDEYIQKGSIDVVISNPPYFKKGDAITNDLSIKAQARHETTAALEDFIKASSSALKNNGILYMVHRPMRLVDIFTLSRKYNLEPKLMQFVYPNQSSVPNIVLIKFVKNGNPELKYLENIYVYNEDRSYTDTVLEIYKNVKIDVFEERHG